MFITYANSKIITIKREDVDGKEGKNRPYVCAYNEHILYAMKHLTPSAFKFYMCLLMNKDGYMEAFSPSYIHEISGLHSDTVRKCFRELLDRRYILPVEGTTAYYVFYEIPQANEWAPRETVFTEQAKRQYNAYFNQFI